MMEIFVAPVYAVSLLIFMITLKSSGGSFNVTDDTYFEIKWPGVIQTPSTSTPKSDSKITTEFEEEESSDSIFVHADASSSYRCFLPNKVHNQKYRKTETDYKGPGPLALLQPLFEQKACSYKIESYWTYELCHGKHLRQYHEEMEGEKTSKKLEFYLGYYQVSNNREMVSPISAPPTEEPVSETKEKNPKGPPIINIEGTNFPFFRVNFSGGSICDLTKQPRQVELLYICLESGRGEIYELVETESCKYRVVVMSKLLCQHPSFTVARPHVNSINCRPADSTTPDKPRALVLQELMQKRAAQAAHTSTLEGLFGRDVKIEATRDKDRVYIKIGSKNKEQGVLDSSSQTNVADEASQSMSGSSETQQEPLSPHRHRIPPAHPPVMLLRRFVNGIDCVVGGAEWWRHEFCFGKHVIQYHDDAQTGKRTTIVLGRWNVNKHTEWASANAHARPVKNKQFSLHYSDGDHCDDAKRDRRVEVRIRCLLKSSSPSAMAIMLQEPKVCDYILTVESSMLCPLVNQVDENGLLVDDLKLD